MDSIQLERALSSHKETAPFFGGVFAADELPGNCHHPIALIVNTDPSWKQGTHWIAIFVDANGRGEYFDSYGIRPFIKEHINFLNRECSTWRYNRKQIQGWTSATCGNYSSLFLVFRCLGYTMRQFTKCFNSGNTGKNDLIVLSTYNLILGKHCKSSLANKRPINTQIGRAGTPMPTR